MTWLHSFLNNLSLRKAIAVVLIVGLAVPVGISTLFYRTERRAALLERLNADHSRIVEVLAFGMRTPLWEIRPDAGESLLEALILDERVTSISVSSPLLPQFLATEEPERRQGEALLLESPVFYADEEIGRVQVEMDTGQLEAQLDAQWGQILLVGFLQFGFGMGMIFALLHYKVIKPLQRLVIQSEALAGGRLDWPLEWRRDDELGDLGRSFEKMRRSLRDLFSNLETRNRDLQDREIELANQTGVLRAILDNMTDGITLIDEHLHLVAWNDRVIKIMGLPEQLFLQGVSIEELARFDLASGGHSPVDRELILQTLRKTYRPGLESATRYQTARGRWVDIRRSPMPGGGFVSTYTDVTDREKARRKADETRLMLEAIMDAVPAGLHVKDLDLRYQLVNRQFLEWLGLERDQVLHKTSLEVFEEDVAHLAETRDRQVIETGKPTSFEEIPFFDDRKPLTTWMTKVPLRDAYGKITHILTVELDISERKKAEAELARHREALHQSEKLSALGSLLAGVAHELNNPLSVVVGRTIMLEEQLWDTNAAKSIVKVRAAAERCARIVKTFLAMARQQESARMPVQIADVIEASLEMLGYGLHTAGVQINLDLEPGLPELEADPDQLNQVFTNLFLNAQHALEAIPQPRRLSISARFDRNANFLRIKVQDNGPGIAPEIRSRIFEPFFTTKEVGEGTGVGLSVSHSIIQSHGGTISVDTPAGGGTVFEILLPVEAVVRMADTAAVVASSGTEGNSILIVDDEPEVAQILGDILTEEGHSVEIAESGRMALQRLQEQSFDLILSDLRMPDLDGPGLYTELESLHPELCDRMVFVTGDTLSEAARRFLMRVGRPVIEKPFIPDEIRRVVGQSLGHHQA